MNKTIYALGAIILIALTGLSFAHTAALVTSNRVEQPVVATSSTEALTSEQQAWLGALEWCESNGNPGAINPKDSDGTPSYGLLQFKPGTFAEFARIYHLASTTDYMDPVEQAQIVTKMIESGTVDFHHQFPDCTHRLGTPPLSTPAQSTVVDR
jgi:transglycosylase-like protein with SLT domain